MNKLIQKKCYQLTPNKTIETILVSNGDNKKTLFIYNYHGVSFRVFSTQEMLDGFWKGEAEEDQHFSTENELDKYLEQITL